MAIGYETGTKPGQNTRFLRNFAEIWKYPPKGPDFCPRLRDSTVASIPLASPNLTVCSNFLAYFPPFSLGDFSPMGSVTRPRWGVVLRSWGDRTHLSGLTERVGIECCRLVAGIDAPRVNITALGGGPHGNAH